MQRQESSATCYSLGFGYNGRKVDIDLFGAGDGLIWLDNVRCSGTELHIGECSHDGWLAHNRSHRHDVAVSCIDNTPVVPVRLAGGSGSAGRLEVLYNGTWGTVCDRFFTPGAASVVCNMLGFGPGTKIDNRNYTTDRGPIWLDGVGCNGTETDIAECSRSRWGVHGCRHSDDAAVSCVRTEVGVRLNGGRDRREGRLEVFHSGAWRSVCEDGFDIAAASVVCNMLGFGHVGRPTTNRYGNVSGPFRWQSVVHCSGTEHSIAECEWNNAWGNNSCAEQAISCLTDNAVVLFGGQSPREGRLEIYHNDIWGTVCGGDEFTHSAARVVCHSLGFGYVGGKKPSAIDYGFGTGTIWLDDVRCDGTERQIGECRHGAWADHNCGHREDVAVVCFGNWSDQPVGDPPREPLEIYFIPVYVVVFVFVFCAILHCYQTGCRKCRQAEHSGRGRQPVVISVISDVQELPDNNITLETVDHVVPEEVVQSPPSYQQVVSVDELPPRYSQVVGDNL